MEKQFNTFQEFINHVVKVATKPNLFTTTKTPTVNEVKSMCITAGMVSIKRYIIDIPVNILYFSTFKEANYRVILDRETLQVKQII